MLKIVTWNVNSLKVRLSHLLRYIAENNPDVVALQETKLVDNNFPFKEFEQLGFHAVYSGQKTYNGVAILSRKEMTQVQVGIPQYDDEQKRVIAATVDDIRIINVYVPNGSEVGSEKYNYKLTWLKHLTRYVKETMADQAKVCVLGDYNIAPTDDDVHDPKRWVGQILCSEPERAAYDALLMSGLDDLFRLFPQKPKSYSWWDYRAFAYDRNWGLRIDHILASHHLAKICQKCYINAQPRGWEKPSDHAPVVGEFA